MFFSIALALSFDFGPQVFRFFTTATVTRKCPFFALRFTTAFYVECTSIRSDGTADRPTDCHLRICNELPELAARYPWRSPHEGTHARHGFINLPLLSPRFHPPQCKQNLHCLSEPFFLCFNTRTNYRILTLFCATSILEGRSCSRANKMSRNEWLSINCPLALKRRTRGNTRINAPFLLNNVAFRA